MSYLPAKNDRFKAKLKDHPDYYYAKGNVLVCLGWTQTYIQKGRKKKARARFCESMFENKLTLPKKLQTADFSLDRSIWLFEAVEPARQAKEAPACPRIDEQAGG